MPELPDVQVFKEYLDATALHRRIRGVHLEDAEDVLRVSRQALASRLHGHELRSTRRHGKNLFVDVTADGWLLLHFGMTGHLRYYKRERHPTPDHARLRIDLSGGYELAYVNQRKLGTIDMLEDPDAFIRRKGLGPDALELDLRGFRKALEGRRRTVKGVLMDQGTIAGIGNVYADEALFAAGVDPRIPAGRLDRDTVGSLHRAMRRVLRQAIEARVDPDTMPSGFLLPHREEGARCPRCRGRLRRAEVDGRATYFCPRHQREAA
ncbi:MAG: DNA-formamidopyrimidine glycosylase family protein [Acidobacteriota bacterium]|jgi:formamidopyrimidine-DNA glycosylase